MHHIQDIKHEEGNDIFKSFYQIYLDGYRQEGANKHFKVSMIILIQFFHGKYRIIKGDNLCHVINVKWTTDGKLKCGGNML